MKKIMLVLLLLLVLAGCNNQFFTDRKFDNCFEDCIEKEGCEIAENTPDRILCSGDADTSEVGGKCHMDCI